MRPVALLLALGLALPSLAQADGDNAHSTVFNEEIVGGGIVSQGLGLVLHQPVQHRLEVGNVLLGRWRRPQLGEVGQRGHLHRCRLGPPDPGTLQVCRRQFCAFQIGTGTEVALKGAVLAAQSAELQTGHLPVTNTAGERTEQNAEIQHPGQQATVSTGHFHGARL